MMPWGTPRYFPSASMDSNQFAGKSNLVSSLFSSMLFPPSMFEWLSVKAVTKAVAAVFQSKSCKTSKQLFRGSQAAEKSLLNDFTSKMGGFTQAFNCSLVRLFFLKSGLIAVVFKACRKQPETRKVLTICRRTHTMQ